MNGFSNDSPFIKVIEELKKQAEIINKNYKLEALELKLSGEIQNDKDETSTGIIELGGKKIDFKKFCTADLGSKYIDLFVGNERSPKTTGEILSGMQETSYKNSQIVTGAEIGSKAIYYAYNHSLALGDISISSGAPENLTSNLGTNIFPTSDGRTDSIQNFYQYCCGVRNDTPSAPGEPTQVSLITDQNEVLGRGPSVENIDRYNSPGMSFFNHTFNADKKSILGINFSLQDADILHAFLNGITTLDLTKAITFLRIGFFAPSVAIADPRAKDKNSTPAYRPPVSLASFLGMNERSILQKSYESSVTAALASASAGSSPYLRNRSLSRLGYEIFLAPQTLVNPDINTTIDQNGFRKFPVRDPMVPLASIESFRVTVQNSPIAAFTTQVCDLKVIVHDKSRLEELSNLIAVQDFPSNFIEIEYGYSHPDADPVTGTAVGKFLDLMKMKQVYTVAGYNMTIKDQSAEINLKLVSLADKALMSVPCITGHLVSVKTVLQYLNNMTLTQFPDALPKGTIQFDPATSAGKMVERKLFIDIVNAVNRSSNYKDDAAVSDAFRVIKSAIDTNSAFSSTDKTPNKMQESMLLAAESFGVHAPVFADTFFSAMASGGRFSFKDNFKNNHKGGKFVTAAQLISRFVLAPLASSTIFDEVQIHCFSFNDRAGYLSKQPIAVCPVDMENLKKRLSYETATTMNKIYSTSEMLNAILKECSNPHAVGFGVSDPVRVVQEARKKAEDAKKSQDSAGVATSGEKTLDESKAEAQLTSKMKDIYKQVYGEDVDDPVFTAPRVRSSIQSLKKTIDAGPNKGKEITVCKIIIYDDSCTSLSEVASILDVASEDLSTYQPKADSTTAGLDKIGTGPRDDTKFVRNILRKLYPTLKIGTGNSVVNGVSIATSTSGDVAQAQLMESLRGVYGAQQESMQESAGEDITVIPAKISFNMPGCPIVNRGQNIFVDLGTGTTLDNVYSVSSISHNIDSRGNFTTAVSLAPTSGGTVRGVSTKIERALKKFTSATGK